MCKTARKKTKISLRIRFDEEDFHVVLVKNQRQQQSPVFVFFQVFSFSSVFLKVCSEKQQLWKEHPKLLQKMQKRNKKCRRRLFLHKEEAEDTNTNERRKEEGRRRRRTDHVLGTRASDHGPRLRVLENAMWWSTRVSGIVRIQSKIRPHASATVLVRRKKTGKRSKVRKERVRIPTAENVFTVMRDCSGRFYGEDLNRRRGGVLSHRGGDERTQGRVRVLGRHRDCDCRHGGGVFTSVHRLRQGEKVSTVEFSEG